MLPTALTPPPYETFAALLAHTIIAATMLTLSEETFKRFGTPAVAPKDVVLAPLFTAIGTLTLYSTAHHLLPEPIAVLAGLALAVVIPFFQWRTLNSDTQATPATDV